LKRKHHLFCSALLSAFFTGTEALKIFLCFFVIVLNHEMALRTKFVEAQLTNLTFLPALFLTLTTKCCDTMHTEIKITGKKSFQTFGQTPEESKCSRSCLLFVLSWTQLLKL